MIKKVDYEYLKIALDMLEESGIEYRVDRGEQLYGVNYGTGYGYDNKEIVEKLKTITWARIVYIVESGRDCAVYSHKRLAVYSEILSTAKDVVQIIEDGRGELLYIVCDEDRYGNPGKNLFAFVMNDKQFRYKSAYEDVKSNTELFWTIPDEDNVNDGGQ